MTHSDYLGLLDAAGQQCQVHASEVLEDHHEVEVGDTLMCLRWHETMQTIEVTVPLPPMPDTNGDEDGDAEPTLSPALCELLLKRHWHHSGSDEGVSFGVVPGLGEVVGMATLDPDTINGPDELLLALSEVHDIAELAWLEVCAQLQAQQHAPPAPARPAYANAPLRA